MGLCRTFSLFVEDKTGNSIYDIKLAEKITNRLTEISGYGGWEGNLDCSDQIWLSDVNWYDWESDMKKLAEEFPGIVFTLHCDGLCLDDVWDAGFCGDRMTMETAYIPELNYQYLRGQSG